MSTSNDPFAAILGTRRGHAVTEADSILSLRPTGRAKEELLRLRRDLEGYGADPTEALAVLEAMDVSNERRPLERHVRGMLARYLAGRAEAHTRHIASRLLTDAKIYDESLSAHVVSVAGDSCIHLWVEGHLYKSPVDTPDGVLLFCGRNRLVPGEQVARRQRGKWRAPSSSRMNSDAWRCSACELALRSARKGEGFVLPQIGKLFPKINDPTVVEDIFGETHERRAHLTALPKYAASRQRKHLIRIVSDRLLSDLSIGAAERESLTRAECLVSSFDTATSKIGVAPFQVGWLRRLGINVTPAMEALMPLLRKEDVAEMLRGLYPPAYHEERDWRRLGDNDAWQEWLRSPGYQEAVASLPVAVAARLKTRRRSK